MNDAQRTIEYVSDIRGQHAELDDLLAELWPVLPDLVLERRGSHGRWEQRIHQVYRFADDSLADLSYSVPLGPDGNDVQPQCSGMVVYRVARQAVEYLTADQRNAFELVEREDYRQPIGHQTEWALGYWREGRRVRDDIIGTGARAEAIARGYRAKQSAPDQLALTTWERISLERRDVYLAPWQQLDTPTTGTADQQPNTTSTPQTEAQK